MPTEVVMEPVNEETTKTRKEVRMHSTIGVGINTIMYTCTLQIKSLLTQNLVCRRDLFAWSVPHTM